MLRIPDITVLAIDVINPIRMLETLRRSLLWIMPGRTVLLTDTIRHPGALNAARAVGVTIVHHQESDGFTTFPGIGRKFFVDYEAAVMREPAANIGRASHVLYMEWDAGVLNPAAWDDSWLQWDYIGAPWPIHNDPGWPACDGESNAVGNSGFSLQSAAFCRAIREAFDSSNDPFRFSCDRWMCRTMRPKLEAKGIRYAPPEVASRFSCEDRIYSGEFGFHGRSTVSLNNWGGWLEGLHQSPAEKRK